MRRLVCLTLTFAAFACADKGPGKLDDARGQLRAGHTDAAIQLLQEQVAKDPAAVDARILLARTLLNAERFDEADAAVEDAVAKHPSDAGLECVLGDLRFREGRVFDAEKAYKAAVKLDEHNARAIYGISRVFKATCLRRRASQMLQVAHAIDPHDPEIAAAFDSAGPLTPAVVARLEAELARIEDPSAGIASPGRERALKRWIAVGKALAGKPQCAPVAADRSYRITLGRVMDGKRLTGASLPVKINGAKTDIRLDTGAGGIIVSNRFAEHAGIERIADTEISGIGNGPAVKGWVGYAPRVQIGDLELRNCIVEAPEKGAGDEASGLIGADVFERFLVKIHFAGHGFDLDPLPGPVWDGETIVDRYDGPELSGFTQMLVVHHYLLIPTLISESTKTAQTQGLFLLDTGANLNMISSNLAPEVSTVRDSVNRVRGVSGRVQKVYEVDKIVLQFATFRQLNLGLTSFDLTSFSRSADMEVSGIMGLPLIGIFASVTLDYRDGRVKFEYKP